MKTINLLILAFVGLFWIPFLPFYFIKGLRGTFEDWNELKDWRETAWWTALLGLQLGLGGLLGFLLYGLTQVALQGGSL